MMAGMVPTCLEHVGENSGLARDRLRALPIPGHPWLRWSHIRPIPFHYHAMRGWLIETRCSVARGCA
jgi:hypothetical protein